ncbi:MAG: 30S ribosomal protein S7 [Verrucomicrobiota bacterium]
MARRRRAEHREVLPDSLYENVLVGRLINTVMERGKKSTASKIVYGAIDMVNEGSGNSNPLEIFNRAIENAKPKIEVKSRRVGGATYQIPMEVPQERQVALAVRWMVDSALKRKGIPMKKALAMELKEAAAGQGNAIKKRDDVHRMAQANRAFAHLRW